jgi:non-heme Fe2+,alpha-ketoglutarate-dependent halogenase
MESVMPGLSAEEVQFYQKNGYISPINILSEKEAISFHEELQSIESKYGSDLTGLGRNNTHQVIPFIDQLAHHPKILDVVQSIIGQNILVAGTTLFIKEPEQAGFISWHQDAKYNGLKPYNWVTAWLALTEVNVENGCMYMWPGSHIDGERDHEDTYGKDNLLTRGQTVANVPDNETVAIELKPGQLSLHHPWIVHGSGQNTSQKRRVGLAIQSYISTDVEQVHGETFVQLGRGIDECNHHPHVMRNSGLMVEPEVEYWKKANKALQGVLYHGAKKLGKF